MRRWLKTLLLGGVFAVLLCTSALAADSGVYNVSGVTPQTAAQAPITAGSGTVNGTQVDKFYAGAERFALPLSNTTEDQYLVFVLEGDGETTAPVEGNIVYIDQKSGAEAGTFDLYPSRLTSGKTYTVCVSSTETGVRKAGSFQYYAPYTLGDINNDKNINTLDALSALRHFAKQITLTGNQFLAADVASPKNTVNTMDAFAILRHFAKQITSFT